MSANAEINPKTGLPQVDQETAAANAKKASVFPFILITILQGIGLAVAYGIDKFYSDDITTSALKTAKERDLKWAYLASLFFSYTVYWQNMYPLRYKESVMYMGNLRANMFIYRLAAEDPTTSSAVVLHEDGDLGYYNRSNRSIYHFLENGLQFIILLPLLFFTWPLPAFVCTVIFCLGRIFYQIGYTNSGFGGHFPGFFLERLATFTSSGLLILACIKLF